MVQQPALPAYRVRFFEAVQDSIGGNLTVVHSRVPNLPNVETTSFPTIVTRTVGIGQLLLWDPGQIFVATRPSAHLDVAILSWNIRYLSLIPALLILRLRGIPTLVWGHGYSKHERSWRRFLRLAIGRLAVGFIVYDHQTAIDLRESVGCSHQVFVARNALDQEPIGAARRIWLRDPTRLEAFREGQNLRGHTLLFVSRLIPENRVDLLLEAGAKLASPFPSLRIVIVGDGPDRHRLEAIGGRLGLDANITWVGQCYDETHLAPWFMLADVFVYPSNAGLSVLHAFGYGIPVVTSGRLERQNPEVRAIRPGDNGAFFRDGDADDLARVLGDLLADEASRKRLGRAALRTVSEEYSLQSMVEAFATAISTVSPLVG